MQQAREGSEVFRRSDRRDETPDPRALAARDAATQAFLALDDEQRAAAEAVEAADELGTGRGLGESWRQVAGLGDRATEAYLAATRAFPLDGTTPPDGSPSPRAARGADERATAEIERAREAIRRFRAAHARSLDEAALVLAGLPRAVQEARTALVTARAAVQRAEAAGVRSRRAVERLAEAERAATLLDAPGPGLRDRRSAAQRTLDLARSAATLAADAPKTAAQVRSALVSVATRRSAAATKAERIPAAMSALRREFAEPCSRDLGHAATLAADALTAADAAIALAREKSGAGDWDGAADQVTAARAALRRAEDRAEVVVDRLTELRDVRTDPARYAAETRFVLRDVQRLVVDRDLVAQFGPVLDAQSVRLRNAQERLTGVHPDYWLYLTELRGVRDRVTDVVTRVRSTRPR